MLAVRLSPEYGVYAAWVTEPDDPIPVNVSPAELADRYGVSADICAQIDEWDRDFQDTYRPDDPMESAFADAEAMNRWWARGMQIARQLAGELGPSIPVEVARSGGGHVVVDPEPPPSGA